MPSYKDPRTGQWYCQFYYEDWTGKKRHKVKRGFPRKKDADEFERNFLSTEHGQEITMGALVDAFVANIDTLVDLGNLSRRTANAKILNINAHVRPYFKDVLAKRVKTVDVDRWLAALSKLVLNPVSYKKGKEPIFMSSSTIYYYRNLLKQIFDFGKKNYNLNNNNPVTLSSPVKCGSNDSRAKFWTLEEYRLFIKTIDSPMYKTAFNVLYFAGLRVGELCALRADCITPFKITVNRSLVYQSAEKQYYKDPKTQGSIRTVEIPQMLYRQIMEYLDSAGPFGKEDRIFPFTPANLNYQLKRAHRKMGLPRISTHCLRHSYASNLYALTNNIAVVTNAIGHEDPHTTLKYYAFALPGHGRQAADILDEKMQEIERKTKY